MATNTADAPAAAAKEKKGGMKLIIILAAVLVLAGGGMAAWMMMGSRHGGDEAKAAPPPTFLTLENMVVNLADQGGDRFAQIGITLELADAQTAEKIKTYLPMIRSSILMLASQRTADELLTRDGKEKLAADIRRAVAAPLGYGSPPRERRADDSDGQQGSADDDTDDSPRRSDRDNPVRKVLFSSFIVQ